MIATAKGSPPNSVRVVHTSSAAHIFVKSVDFETLYEGQDGKNKKRHKLGKNVLYAQSKFVRSLHQLTENFVLIFTASQHTYNREILL